MRTIAVINQKGGVGKTTTSVNLAAALAEMGQRVLLIDLDPQAHASLHLGLTLEEGDPSIYDVLTGEATLGEVRRRVHETLWVVPSHIDLAAAEIELAGEVGREVILRDKLQEEGEFDVIVLDCPPSLGILTLNALTTVEEVLLPIQPHFLALHGVAKLLRTIDVVAQRLNPRLRLSGVLFCMYDSGTRLAAEVVRDVEEFLAEQATSNPVWSQAHAYRTRIRRNIRLAEAPSFGQSIFEYAPSSNGAVDYQQFAAEFARPTSSKRRRRLPAAG
ncbi:MAG: AAA family ATPase [Pirellulaceae bacterium]|jgi:chromosome partitioning protein|nr:AAA family ATPase [Pirellulaceae bacterium]MDP7017797.1 AAA family ATPase [Pirellulaceae bacterium]